MLLVALQELKLMSVSACIVKFRGIIKRLDFGYVLLDEPTRLVDELVGYRCREIGESRMTRRFSALVFW